jgi:hypothetical protein
MRKQMICTAVAVAAIGAVGAGTALAGQGDNNGNDGNPVVSYVFKGTFVGIGGGFPTAARKPVHRGFFDLATVNVDHGNAHVWKNDLEGPILFDFTNADFVVKDTNGDGVQNLRDVRTGDRVVVKARMHLRDPGPQPFEAVQLVDQTN